MLGNNMQITWPQSLKNITISQRIGRGKKYAGVDLKCDYEKRTCISNMNGYILELRNKYGHLTPKKPQHSPHKQRPIYYGARQQLVQLTDDSPPLNDKGIKRVQGFVGALLYIGRAVNNKLIVALRAIGSQQAATTEETKYAIEQLLDYVATYPGDGILFRRSDMILAAHGYAGFINESEARIRAGAHIFLSENESNPKLSGPVLTISQIIKTVMASAPEAEMEALYITARKTIPLHNILIEVG